MPPPPGFEARLASVRPLSPTVRELAFERIDGKPMAFEPGQWVNVMVPIASTDAHAHPGGSSPASAVGLPGSLKRSYSIASQPHESERFEIAVTRVQGGPASTWLHAVAPGAVLRFAGPQGFFTRPPARAPPSLMVATGTGVTPMRSMILAAASAGSRTPVTLLLGVRHEQDVLYGSELAAMARGNPFFRFHATLSRPEDTWDGRRGYVQAHVRELWDDISARAGAPAHAYVCGLERMVGSVRDLLRKEMNLPREQVHTERYD